jgi:hypothetical protein
MAEYVDDRYYAVVDEKPKGVSKDDFDQAKDKLAAKAEGKEYEAPKPQAEQEHKVVANDRPAADEPTIAEAAKEADKPKASKK